MANQAQKKRNAKARQLTKWFGVSLLVVNLIYLALHLAVFEDVAEDLWKNFAIHSVVSAALFFNIVKSARDGFDYEYSFDALVLNMTVQTLSLYSSNAWYLFLIIPVLLFYKFAMFIKGYLGSSS